MNHLQWNVGLIITLGASLVFALFGIAVWLLNRGSTVNRTFGLFGVLFGTGAFLQNVGVFVQLQAQGDFSDAWLVPVAAPFTLAAGVALVRLARLYPTLGPAAERAARPAAWLAALLVPTYIAAGALVLRNAWGPAPVYALGSMGFYAVFPAFWYAVFRYAFAYPHVPATEAGQRRSLLLMAAALSLYVTQVGFTFWFFTEFLAPETHLLDPQMRPLVGLSTLLPLALVAIWLKHAANGDGTSARNMAWVTLAGPLMAFLFWAIDVPGGSGFARLFIVLLLSYAIVRHHLMDIDVKVRWGVSKSTVAGVFIAVFFVASEGAQLVFGGENEIVGLFAAGALVFAISPLQRVADRIAVKAVPLPSSAPGAVPAPAGVHVVSRQEARYRSALQLALQDRRLTREEEVALHELAEGLGIPAGRAHALLVDVERELRPTSGTSHRKGGR